MDLQGVIEDYRGEAETDYFCRDQGTFYDYSDSDYRYGRGFFGFE